MSDTVLFRGNQLYNIPEDQYSGFGGCLRLIFWEKLSIYTHFSDFFMAVTCKGMRKNYICIEFGLKV